MATNPLPLPFNSATTTGWQFDLCRLQSEAWWAWFKSYIDDCSSSCEQENVDSKVTERTLMIAQARVSLTTVKDKRMLIKSNSWHLSAIGNCFASWASLHLNKSKFSSPSCNQTHCTLHTCNPQESAIVLTHICAKFHLLTVVQLSPSVLTQIAQSFSL